MNTVQRNLVEGTCCASLATTNQALDGQDVAGIEVTLLLVGEEFLNLLVLLRDNAVLRISENLVETVDEVHESCHLLVAYSDVARCLVSHVNLVLLLNQAADGATHRDNVIVWVRREDNHLLWEWLRTLWAISIVSVRLATRPSGDGVLQVVENLDVGIVCRAVESQKFAQAVLVVILVGQFQDRLVQFLAEPYQCRTHLLVGPLAVGYEPWMLDAGEVGSCAQVEDDVCIRMSLEEACWQCVSDVSFYHLLHDVSLLVAPSREIYFLGRE